MVFIVAAFFGIARFSEKSSNLQLQADKEAAALLGQEPLLQILTRIDSLGLEDLERIKRTRKYARRFASPKPSITERINNLANKGQ